jgi:hypothetical protein
MYIPRGVLSPLDKDIMWEFEPKKLGKFSYKIVSKLCIKLREGILKNLLSKIQIIPILSIYKKVPNFYQN